MRKFILIAAMALASASAQAGESRSLSTGLGTTVPSELPAAINTQQLRAQNDTPATTAPRQTETPRYSLPTETPPPAQPGRNISEAPRDTTRPAPVDNAPSATASTTPSATAPSATAPSTITPSTTTPASTTPSITRRERPSDDTAYRPSRSRHAYSDRAAYAYRPHYRRTHWTAGRIIAALHRYGIYW